MCFRSTGGMRESRNRSSTGEALQPGRGVNERFVSKEGQIRIDAAGSAAIHKVSQEYDAL